MRLKIVYILLLILFSLVIRLEQRTAVYTPKYPIALTTQEDALTDKDTPLSSDACILPITQNILQVNKNNNFVYLFILVAVVALGLSNSEKWQLLLQPAVHISHKLPYILYPFHSFW